MFYLPLIKQYLCIFKPQMLNRFVAHIEKEGLFTHKHRLLLAISGGLDSVVLCHLLKKGGFAVALAHCNFQLRGEESEGDELFIKQLVETVGFEPHIKRFDTQQFAAENKLSIQMAARKLRYAWFEELMKAHKFDFLLTAHHLNDNIETFLLNFTRGTGMKGLRGIPVKAGKIVRPLLVFERAELEEYATANALAYREDSSNYEEKYARNLIRKSVIPVLKKLNPALEKTFLHNLNSLKPVFDLAENISEEKRKILLKKKQGYDEIDAAALLQEKYRAFFLFDLLSAYGFNGAQCEDALQMLHSLPGKKIESADYVLLRDRESFLIRKKRKTVYHELVIEDFPSTVLFDGIGIRFSIHGEEGKGKGERDEKGEGNENPLSLKLQRVKGEGGKRVTEIFDLDKLKGTCVIRPWKEGDRFQPGGMTGTKKLSDFFVSEKMNLFEKEDCRILTCDEKIVWIIGRRADARFLANESTKKIVKAELI